MAEGKADVIDTIFETPERQVRLDFTPAYAQIPVSIYTHKSITGIVIRTSTLNWRQDSKDVRHYMSEGVRLSE